MLKPNTNRELNPMVQTCTNIPLDIHRKMIKHIRKLGIDKATWLRFVIIEQLSKK